MNNVDNIRDLMDEIEIDKIFHSEFISLQQEISEYLESVLDAYPEIKEKVRKLKAFRDEEEG